MKKALSVLLSLLIVFSVIMPGLSGIDLTSIEAEASTAGAGDAYATIFTSSDFQNGLYIDNLNAMIENAKEDGVVETPEAFFFGGDYYSSSSTQADPSSNVDLLKDMVDDNYPYYNPNNLVFLQGNHDTLNSKLKETGLYEYDDFLVYVCNYNDYSSKSESTATAFAADLSVVFDRLLSDGEDRPIFILTHMPLHHNNRGNKVYDSDGNSVKDADGNYIYDYVQNTYSKYVVDVLNAYGNYLDIVFMYGHNHSGAYDDYIGGSVNFLGKGDTMYVSALDSSTADGSYEYYDGKYTYWNKVELTFTYMNYGYVAYSNNTEGTVTDEHTGNTVKSTNTLTMGVLEICPDKIVVSRYTTEGKYAESKTISRITPSNKDGGYDEPYVNVAGYLGGTVGVQTGAYANATGFSENAVYTWTSSNTSVATVKGVGSTAQVAYKAVGTSEITVTVTDGNATKSASYTVTVGAKTSTKTYAQIRMGVGTVSGTTVEYYNTEFPKTVNLIGCYEIAADDITVTNETWTSSDTSVATVDNGNVTFIGNGEAKITFSFINNGTTYSSSVTFVVSNGDKQELKYVQTDSFEAGKSYIIVINYDGAYQMINNVLEDHSDSSYTVYLPQANSITLSGSDGSYYFTTNSSSHVWHAEDTGTEGTVYLKNAESGLYFNIYGAAKSSGGTSTYTACASFSETASGKWTADETNGIVINDTNFNSGGVAYLYAKNGYAQIIPQIRANCPPIIFEQVVEVSASIEMGDEDVTGTTQTVYSVTSDTQIPLYGAYKNYGENVKEEWGSSDTSVAAIDENGVLSFTGKAGTTTVTYTVKSSTVSYQQYTVVIEAKTGAESKRTFKYVDEITPNKSYVLVYKEDTTMAGDGYVLTTNEWSSTKLYPGNITVKSNDVRDYLYVEIDESDSDDIVWMTVEGPKAGANGNVIGTEDIYYFYTEESDDGAAWNWENSSARFLGAMITGYGTWGVEGELYTVLLGDALSGGITDFTPFQFVYDGSNIYNQYSVSVSNDSTGKSYDGYTGIRYHSSNYFGVAEYDDSNMMLFEEIEAEPTSVILSNYRYVGKTVSRDEICPLQTEQLSYEAENFPEGDMTVTWSSSDTSVATIDQNGKLTYTGASGITTITLTITVTSDVEGTVTDTQTVDIYVNVSQALTGDIYYLTNSFVAGNKYVIANANAPDDNGALLLRYNDYSRSSGKTDKRTENVTVQTLGTYTYIQNPAEEAVWECIASEESGFYYLKNVYDNKYLVGNYSSTYADCKLTSAETLTEYDSDAYLFRYRVSSAGYLVLESKQSKSNSAYLYCDDWGSSGAYTLTSTASNLYLYSFDGKGTEDTPVTQIRTVNISGSKDITNTIINNYNTANGDTTQLYRYVENVRDGYTYSWSSGDTSIAAIDSDGIVTFTGKEGYVTFSLTVSGTDADGNAYKETVSATIRVFSGGYVLSDSDYPEYPYEGSVRINKTASNTAGGNNFQDSGVTQVELGVTGVPVEVPVDVVVVFDHSSSMNDNNMLSIAIDDTLSFALRVLDSNVNNRVAIVAYDSIGSRYSSVLSQTVVSSLNEAECGVVTGSGVADNTAFVGTGDEDALARQIDSLITNNVSGTNYDYGLKMAYDILKSAKDNGSENEPVVVFMSDGQPNQFNGLQMDYGSEVLDTENGMTYNDISTAWVQGDEEALSKYLNDLATYPAMALFNPDGDNWYAQALKAPEGTATGVPDYGYYDNYREGLGATIFTLGYAVKDTYGILGRMASVQENFFSSTVDLQTAFDSILNQLLNAAEDAVVTDTLGSYFDLQFASEYTMGSETVTLDPGASIEVGSWTLDVTGNRVDYSVIEKITFTTNANGNLTQAYSSVTGDTNIYNVAQGMINGTTVTYDLNTETFTWKIGDITNNEVTLKYYANLIGAADGEREAGTYETNKSAVLDYINYRGTACSKTFAVPTLGWKQAAVSYDFYLVNANGDPINMAGIVVPFAERVLVGREQTKQLYINQGSELSAYNLVADYEIPEGYVLYNEDAIYGIYVSDTDGASYAYISDDTLTTYYRDGSVAYAVNDDLELDDYINTSVSFAVQYTEGLIADSVVIDYGLPVKISVLANDYGVSGGTLTAIGKTLTSGTTLHTQSYTSSRLTDGVTTGLALDNGTAYISGDYVVFTPSGLTMDAENVFYYEYKTADSKYFYGKITVIPATSIYYEESFITFNNGDGYSWKDAGTTFTDIFQSEDRPGTFSFTEYDADNPYGNDSAYDSSYTYSLGNAKYTSVDAEALGKEPTAEFTFCGTGFDLFSVTNSTTGAVLVTVYSGNTVYRNYLVSTYYGYSTSDGVLTPDSGSTASLYQVPVVSVDGFAYGTYRVVIKPIYSSAFDPNYDSTLEKSENAYDIYVDSVRIFDPAGPDGNVSDVAGEAYLDDGEYAPVYQEVRDTLLSAEAYYEELVGESGLSYTGSIYLDGSTSNGIDETGLATYKASGPNNELYLGYNQAIAFMVSADDEMTLSSLQLGMKVVSGDSADIAIMNTKTQEPNTVTVTGSYESYKKLSKSIVWDQNKIESDKYETMYAIVVVNTTPDTVISLTSFKWAHQTDPESGSAAAALSFYVTEDTPMMASFAMSRAIAYSEDEELTATPYTDEDITMEWSDTTFTEGNEATLTITTPFDVVGVTVGDVELTQCEIDENGNKRWTYTFIVEQTGENTYDVLLFDVNGNMSEAIQTETITVEAKKSIFQTILDYIKSILTFLWRLFS